MIHRPNQIYADRQCSRDTVVQFSVRSKYLRQKMGHPPLPKKIFNHGSVMLVVQFTSNASKVPKFVENVVRIFSSCFNICLLFIVTVVRAHIPLCHKINYLLPHHILKLKFNSKCLVLQCGVSLATASNFIPSSDSSKR